jgi:hypothetical protein
MKLQGRKIIPLLSLLLLASGPALCAEKLPSWKGIWESEPWTNRTAAGRPEGGAATVNAKSVLTGHPPYKPAWEARYQAGLKDTAAIAAFHAKRKTCGFGFPMIMESPSLFQVFVMPEDTLFVFVTQDVRHIYTDGRPHPPKDESWPTRMGDAIGHWEGDTLVIETVSRLSSMPLTTGSPMSMLSEEARFTERIRQVAPDRLENEMTIEDPVALTRPWKLKLTYKKVTDLDRLGYYDCLENDRNPVVDGKLTIAPP